MSAQARVGSFGATGDVCAGAGGAEARRKRQAAAAQTAARLSPGGQPIPVVIALRSCLWGGGPTPHFARAAPLTSSFSLPSPPRSSSSLFTTRSVQVQNGVG